jgi:hypothetical protein
MEAKESIRIHILYFEEKKGGGVGKRGREEHMCNNIWTIQK